MASRWTWAPPTLTPQHSWQSAQRRPLCAFGGGGEERQTPWPIMLPIPLWQQVRLTCRWREAVCLCRQATKVKHVQTGAECGLFVDADVTCVSLKNGVKGFPCQELWSGKIKGSAWTVAARDSGLWSSTTHSSGVVVIKAVYRCYSWLCVSWGIVCSRLKYRHSSHTRTAYAYLLFLEVV